jgi:tRNA (uracil-5-)-methyltransferase
MPIRVKACCLINFLSIFEGLQKNILRMIKQSVVLSRFCNNQFTFTLFLFFSLGRAEFLLPELLKKSSGLKSVAVVDPPRAGLHAKAISALRSSDIETLVYVSCDAKAAMSNFIDLGRMTSNAYKGEPFVPKKIIPVDLFPHTKHFELIILFERYSLKKALELDVIKDDVSSDITDKDENNQLTKTSV